MLIKKRKKNLKIFRIPISWEMYGYLDILALNLEDAIGIAEAPETNLPLDGEYVMDSDRVDREVLGRKPKRRKRNG
jgi:hypothetical protein